MPDDIPEHNFDYLIWAIRHLHNQEDVLVKFENEDTGEKEVISIPFARTYLEQFDQDARAGMHPPGTKRPKPRVAPCPVKLMPRNDYIVRAVELLRARGRTLREAYREIEEAMVLEPEDHEERALKFLMGRDLEGQDANDAVRLVSKHRGYQMRLVKAWMVKFLLTKGLSRREAKYAFDIAWGRDDLKEKTIEAAYLLRREKTGNI